MNYLVFGLAFCLGLLVTSAYLVTHSTYHTIEATISVGVLAIVVMLFSVGTAIVGAIKKLGKK